MIPSAPVAVPARAPAWYDGAGCRGQSRLFYPPAGESAGDRVLRERAAGGICARCPVLTACRTWARDQHEFGFWGGESEAARTAAGFVPRTVAELRVGPDGVTRAGRTRVQTRARRIRTIVP